MGMGNNPINQVDPDGAYSKFGAWWRNGFSSQGLIKSGDEWGYMKSFGFVTEDYYSELGNSDGKVLTVTYEQSAYVFGGKDKRFSEYISDFGVGVFNPAVDVSTTLWTSLANGYSNAYYGSTYHPDYDQWYPYSLGKDWKFHKNLSNPNSIERKRELMLNTTNVVLSAASSGIKIPVSSNGALNLGGNIVIKGAAKGIILKGVEKSLETVH